MASSGAAQAWRQHIASAARGRSSLAWSAGLYAALIAALARAPWSAEDVPEPTPPAIAWLVSSRLPEPESPSPPTEPIRPEPLPPPAEEAVEPGPPEPRQTRRSAPRRIAASQPSRPPTREHVNAEPPDTTSKARIDWARERQRAIEELRARHETDGRYPTFSADDLVPAPASKDPNPWHEALGPLFNERPGSSAPPRNFAAVGQSRTRVGRALADFCNALTGGFGVALQGHTFFSLCARVDSGPDLDSPIRPETLKWLPECTPVPGGETPTLDAPGAADVGMKCRLRGPAELARERRRAVEEPLRVGEP
jgi:hypothetical protein